ncbi:unnamed protein product [Bemisia tabaci]|uniref:Ubiquitin-like protease family profile domain-containing protein n=1 Tax=Bemisia tabaci TaxID=7038 RepID=A0A9P0F870_BEMTA|nr:unnamed protein product [Bemisia tabaci]
MVIVEIKKSNRKSKRRNHRSKSGVNRFRARPQFPNRPTENSNYVRLVDSEPQPSIPGAQTLRGSNWLSCNVVNEFVKLVCDSAGLCRSIDSTLFIVLTDPKLGDRIFKWAECVRVSSGIRQYFLPICVEDHWSLLHVDVSKSTGSHVTSMSQTGNLRFLRTFLRFLSTCNTRQGKNVDFCNFETDIVETCLQPNLYDCGVYVCLLAFKISRGLDIGTALPEATSDLWRRRIYTCLREKSVRLLEKIFEK